MRQQTPHPKARILLGVLFCGDVPETSILGSLSKIKVSPASNLLAERACLSPLQK
jgi:hypothetical protein